MKEDLPYPKQRLRLPVILSPHEVAQLIGAARNLYHRTILMTLCSTGLRRAELCRLKVADVDGNRMMPHVIQSKGGIDRDLGRNALRGPDFVWSDLYPTKWFALTERVKLRQDAQFFNLFNQPEFCAAFSCLRRNSRPALTQTGFGALTNGDPAGGAKHAKDRVP
jgi:integrase